MAGAPAMVDPVRVADVITTGAPAAAPRCAAPISVGVGDRPPPARGRNISSPAIPMATAPTPADAYSTVRVLRAGLGESPWADTRVDRRSSRAGSPLAESPYPTCERATSARPRARCAPTD